MRPVSNEELRIELLPPAGDVDTVFRFALTYDGYEASGGFDECADPANAALERFDVDGVLPATLSELRNCLFFEQRRWRHFGEPPSPEAEAYLSALMDAIRQKVAAGDLA